MKHFQRDQQIKVDGIVGPVTQSKFQEATQIVDNYPGYYISLGSTGEVVKHIQRRVGAETDGIFGPKTQQAVKAYQQKHGLKIDGIVGPKTWNHLF
ncbi:hypothetical protein J416_03071 [Gracilibacillus halophilus YIM-C55.5]|uniref:Peptidoglycan binding-like domain-containing protein n=1 Tax=Gracilibacillus halophilus YIM-C55.5 TaxID=1308866 RepID=N4WXV0_9BACI|nr:peptidoglycan-binding protein [Gracilibacillus halophilus]ENH97901.1 hypothetical protein J416_03071 [Gracilibacillus halophilus YIM-C55.5]